MGTMTKTAIQTAADEARSFFTRGTRADGSTYWHTTDGAPDWMTDLCREAHDHAAMLPDDWRYEAIVEALDAFGENEDPDDVEPEADIYTADLKRWLLSCGGREDYVDQAISDGLVEPSAGLVAMLSAGQYLELREVYDSIRQSLEERAEALEGEDG